MRNQEMNVFELCLTNRRMSTDELLSWLQIEMEYDCCEFGGRYLRRIGDGNLMEFSCLVEDFDRWANSREEDEYGELQLLFDLNRPAERRRFIRFVQHIYSSVYELVV